MDPTYSWQSVSRQTPSFKIETTRNLGWWILLALLISVFIHIFLYLALGEMQWFGGAAPKDEIVWKNQRKQLTIDRDKLEQMLPTPEPPKPEPVEPAKLSDLPLIDKSLDEFDLMERAKDKEVKLTPEVNTAQIFTNERPTVPKQALESIADSIDVSAADVLSRDLKEMREKLLESSVVSNDQPLMELNNDDLNTGVDTDEFFRKAASKAFGGDADKFMEGYSSLDGLIGATGGDLPPGEEKILMPTDILFEYNEYALKEAARLSMMKLAFIVQTNPTAQFVIEGHTDSFGNEEYNLDLSMKRAVAVRDWLVERLQIGSDNIKVMGLGKTRPIVNPGGTVEEQSLNRRVEIVIRKS
ncbi:MAG: OmpA family protein [Verrucomicrobiales bacterium]|nr:OmpA family protein [Verrucomicrobiales bacterium]